MQFHADIFFERCVVVALTLMIMSLISILVGYAGSVKIVCDAHSMDKQYCLSDQYTNACIWCEYETGNTACVAESCKWQIPERGFIAYNETVGYADPNNDAHYWKQFNKISIFISIGFVAGIVSFVVLAACFESYKKRIMRYAEYATHTLESLREFLRKGITQGKQTEVATSTV